MVHSASDMSSATPPRTYRSGQWMVVECRSGLDASSSGWLREILGHTRDSTWTGVVVDFTGVNALDPSGKLLLQNFHRSLVDQGRSLGLVTDRDDLRRELAMESGATLLSSLSELKRSIHEMPADRMRVLQILGGRTSNLLSFRLRCPVCRYEDVKGWLPDPHQHRHEWFPHEITRQLVAIEDPANSLPVDAYLVAVCPECLFAASRIDWFDLPGSQLPSTLPEGGIERLSKGFARRRAVMGERNKDVPYNIWFGMPRTREAIQMSWTLCEESLRALGRDRASTDGFGISVAILMQAKFAGDDDDLNRFFTAAYVWLRQVSEAIGSYAEDRLAEAHVYLLSVELALGREAEARAVLQTLESRWHADPDAQAWLERARSLLK